MKRASPILRSIRPSTSAPRAAARPFAFPSSSASPCCRPRFYSEQTDAARTKNAVGPFTLRAAAVFAVTGGGLYMYFQSEKRKIAEKKAEETAAAKIGRPKIGGPFVLTDQNGNEFSDKDLLGKWSMVYFGFTNCPDICPEELDKMSIVVNDVAKSHATNVLPVFITCDPARDNIAAVKAYVKGEILSVCTYEDIKKCCKAYRVYFSTPPNAKPTDDYLVDHSIFFYLMDPNGKFVDAFGRSMGADAVSDKVRAALDDWKAGGGRGSWTE
ncbi:mitochondrial metallochaperone Sco1 [Pseudohyphozyma bogoriensis]|nr:mitochondrial metallochaperone Sco1 [Pseudohyphozyma bogoriensis]